MIELYLNDQLVYPEIGSSVKITKENPYFTQSGTYTLDVTIPMTDSHNSAVLGNMHRKDVSKPTEEMTGKLVVNNHVYIDGTATITQVTQDAVKIQLLGGNSDINFYLKNGEKYIDEVYSFSDLGITWNMSFLRWEYEGKPLSEYTTIEQSGIPGIAMCMPVYDGTYDIVRNEYSHIISDKYWSTTGGGGTGGIWQPNFLLFIKIILNNLGYQVRTNDFDCEPYTNMYICNARGGIITGYPISDFTYIEPEIVHWTVEDSMAQVQYFLNCTFVFDDVAKIVDILSNKTYFDGNTIELDVIDDYTTEAQDEDSVESIGSSNLHYDMNADNDEMYAQLDEDILESYIHKEYDTLAELQSAASAMTLAERKSYIFDCPVGRFVAWTDDDWETWYLKQVDHMADLVRDEESDNSLDIKICPCAMMPYKYTAETESGLEIGDTIATVMMPVINNANQRYLANIHGCVMDAITDEDDTTDYSSDEEDRMQIFFVDDVAQSALISDEFKSTVSAIQYPQAFVDGIRDSLDSSNMHNKWSMAIVRSQCDFYLGQQHDIPYKFGTDNLLQYQFQADQVPAINSIFIIHNKRFVCQKIEVTMTDNDGADGLMTGYFYAVD